MRSIIDINDVSTAEVNTLLKTAHDIISQPHHYRQAAGGKILATLFYEPSTRTRLSFEAAMYRLGGNILSMPSARDSSVAKGETIADTLAVVSNYADIVAVRYPNDGAALVAAQAARVPVINAGDGGHFHPTQTLADMLTIDRAFGRLGGLNIVAVGDLLYGRTVHSLLHALMRYPGNTFTMVSPPELRLPADFVTQLRAGRVEVIETSSLPQALADADVIYMTRIQQERFEHAADYERLKSSYELDAQMMAYAPPSSIVMHPLPRVGEISIDVDSDPRARYFEQTYNGKIMRMALIDYLLSDAEKNPDAQCRREILDSHPDEKLHCANKRCVVHVERGLVPRFYGQPALCAYCDYAAVLS
ncbi:aspartate carbamoyltransferase [Arcanobacterium buesumense]|uniref:Aspartate carbamoyltransferase n=1 Tax=Arcanobacterium buesumense TaxID=2722751 RepID=A0A6H2EK17_9ACTO|nr:aspartate carbamoyltransferase [Arcanobacterium buesumense]QJC21915.1 aspartate carbamoyltransferase [Arcanobacterium buesumense]